MTPELTREERFRMAVRAMGRNPNSIEATILTSRVDIRDAILECIFHPIYGRKPAERDIDKIDDAAIELWESYCAMAQYAYQQGKRDEAVSKIPRRHAG